LNPGSVSPQGGPATGPVRTEGSSAGIRHSPYGESGFKTHGDGSDEGEPARQGRVRKTYGKQDYVLRFQVESIRPLDGLETTDLNLPQARGRWREILTDTLEQVGVPYSLHGIKGLVAEAYGLRVIPGQKRHPENRWQVRQISFTPIRA
jgi:hypothetical protein